MLKSRLLRALAVLTLLASGAVHSQGNAAAEAEYKAAVEAARKVQVQGPVEVPVRDQAVLKLPAGYVFIPAPAATQLMNSMGNSTDDSLAGVIFPTDDKPWLAVVRYINEGHIKDDDAKDWNADELLKNLKEGTEAGNAERSKRGITPIEVSGWAEKPAYDVTTHRLVWSAISRAKGSASNHELGVNYNTYALGREGYISLNLVTGLAMLPQNKPAATELLAALHFNEGRRYADFNSSTDKVAAYGLATLVAGAAAKKLGLFAVILAFLAKFAKVIIVAGGAALWGIAKVFGKKREEPAPMVADTQQAEPRSPAA